MMNTLDAVTNDCLRMERAGEGKENSKKKKREKARQKKIKLCKEQERWRLKGPFKKRAERKTVWWFPKNLNIELPYDPVIPLLGIYLTN